MPPYWISPKIITYQKRLNLNFCGTHFEYCPTKTSAQVRPVTRILCGGGGGGANEAKVDQTPNCRNVFFIV